jgi:hypothetical protein
MVLMQHGWVRRWWNVMEKWAGSLEEYQLNGNGCALIQYAQAKK